MTTYEQTNSPHGKVKVYFSKNVESGLHQGNFSQVPLGTVAIAMFDNDGRDGNDGFAVMTKEDQSYDSANGNWSFEMRDKGGDPIAGQAGRVQSCIQCHNGFSATDHLASVRRGIVGGGPGAFQSDYASSSSFYSQMSQMILGRSQYGRVKIYYSSNLKSQIDLGRDFTDVPVGTVAIKHYELTSNSNDRCKPSAGLAVMVKENNGSGTANHGWRFEIRSATDALVTGCEDAIRACQACHQLSNTESDWLRGTLIRN